MECTISDREFILVQYPGIVKNDERAIETLGGLQSLNKSFNSLTRRLRLSFRPEMLYSKPVYGDPHPKTALIVRAKQLKNSRTGEIKIISEMVGVASRIYTFNSMVDFQYGPFERVHCESSETTTHSHSQSDHFRVFYNQLLVKEPTRVLDPHLRSDVPLFLPPLLFTRLDQPTMYCFSSRFRMNEYVELENNSQQHPYHRKERKSYAMFVNFGDPIPSAAHPGALQAITNLSTHTRKLAHDVEKLFNRRPIWGKAALVHSLNWKRVRECAIKTILPAYAYYVPNGPWGRVWIRFGYDPCRDASSRIYQTVDYRVRSPRLQAKLCISGRRPRSDDREDTDASGSDVDDARDTAVIDTVAIFHSGDSPSTRAALRNTSAFRFSKTSWPDARQILYQLVDIDVPEVVEMLSAPVLRTVCDPNCGWMANDYQKRIRDIMTRYLEILSASSPHSGRSTHTRADAGFRDSEVFCTHCDEFRGDFRPVTPFPMSLECGEEVVLPSNRFPMTQRPSRRAFIAYKHGLDYARNCSDPVEPECLSVVCEYVSAAVNPRPSCISVQRFHHSGRPQMLAFGSSRAVCLALEVNNDIRVFKTLSGHKDMVNCVEWVDSFAGPTFSRFHSVLLSASGDGEVKLWDIGEEAQQEIFSFNVSSSVIGIHGCYFDASETQIIVGVASQEDLTACTIKLAPKEDAVPVAEVVGETSCISFRSHPCLALRLVCFKGPFVLLFVGLTTGCLEVRIVKPGEKVLPLAGLLKGHLDWLISLDCVKLYASETKDESCVKGDHVLVATGSQDNQIRIWHVQLVKIEDETQKDKGQLLELPIPYSNTHTLSANLESVLSGHDNWVTGVAWSPVPWTPISCPQLLSASRDKSLVIWAPSQPLFSNAGITPVVNDNGGDEASQDLWLEKTRFGTMGSNSLGYLACAWGGYNLVVYGHGYWGELSTWSTDAEPRITLTGHFGSVTSLSWCREVVDGAPLKSLQGEDEQSSSCLAYPPYLLTASRDFTVRLHGLFYTGGTGCSPPVRNWRELARPQVHGYEINDLVSLDVAHYVSAADEKVARVFSATGSFVKSFLNDATIADHSSLQTLVSAAIRPALGLSNQVALERHESVDEETVASHANSFYPPTESVLAESTLWIETGKLYGHSYEVYSLALHPKGCLLASACKAAKEEFAQIFLWQTETWEIHQKLSYHRLTVAQMRFDATGDRFVSVSRDRTWALWKVEEGRNDKHPTFSLSKHSQSGRKTHSRIIWGCAWSPDCRAFLTASRDKQIMAWDGDSGERMEPPWSLSEPITAFDVGAYIFNTEAFFVAAGFETGGIELLAISLTDRTCRSLWTMPTDWSHMGLSVRCLALHPLNDESVALASGGDDGIVRIFRISPSSLLQLTCGA